MKKLKVQKIIFIIVALLSQPTIQAQELPSYGAQGLYSLGSSRILAMGGAYAALSEGAEASRFNPSGLALGNWNFDLVGTHNRVAARDADQVSQGLDLSEPYDFFSYTAALRWEDAVLGLSYSTPYNLSVSSGDQYSEINLTDIDISIAWRFGKYFSVGMSGHQKTLTESLGHSTAGIGFTPVSLDGEGQALHLRAGAMYRDRDFGFGVVYSPEVRIALEDADKLNLQTPNHDFFRDVLIPEQITYGLYARADNKLIFLLDLNIISPTKGAIYGASSTYDYGANSGLPLSDERHQILRAGFEWTVKDSRSSKIAFQGGTYKEPGRLSGANSRQHITFGLEVRFGPAILTVAFDQSDNFNNTAQGFSLSFGDI